MEHAEIGERGSDNVLASATEEGVRLEMSGGDGKAWCDLEPEAAMRLGYWLITQAVLQGAAKP